MPVNQGMKPFKEQPVNDSPSMRTETESGRFQIHPRKVRVVQIQNDTLDAFNGKDEFIRSSRDNSYFHTLDYFRSLSESREIIPIGFAAIDETQKMVGIAIGELTDEVKLLPFLTRRLIFYAPPMFQDFQVLEMLISRICSVKSGLFIQIRYLWPRSKEELEVYQRHGFAVENHFNAVIPLTDENEILRRMKRDKRRGIQRASEQYQLTVMEMDDARQSVEQFYRIQRKLFRQKRHSIRSENYFLNLIQGSRGRVRIAFAMYHHLPIATQLYIVNGNYITAFYTATLKEYRDRHAGDLLIWYLIKAGFRMGVKFFDFGGGGDPRRFYSPREYKRGFGAVFEDVGRLTKSTSPLYPIAKYARQMTLGSR